MEGAVSWEDRIGRRLKLRDVHILLTVVQSGGMAKAAERLAVSQPVVSKTITDLEHTLGVRLLDRSRKGVEVTPYGRALLDRGVAAFDELRQGVKEIEFLSDPTAGEVRMAGTPPMVLGLLPAVIDRLRRQHPRSRSDRQSCSRGYELCCGGLGTLTRRQAIRCFATTGSPSRAGPVRPCRVTGESRN